MLLLIFIDDFKPAYIQRIAQLTNKSNQFNLTTLRCTEDDIKKMAEYLSSLSNVKRVDVLPFHKMGEYKWKELRYEYVLYDTKAPTAYAVKNVKNIFSSFGLYAP